MNPVDLDRLLEPLEGITKPGRYLGGEWNQPPAESLAARPWRAVLAYPDLYELGMSHLGLKILLHIVEGLAGWAGERVFLPAPDLASRMRERDVPLFSLETRRPVAACHVLGFSLQTENTYTNLLAMLELAGLPRLAADRNEDHPLVVAGGSGAYHPEPLAPFIDLFVLGDGEEALPALLTWLADRGGPAAAPRERLLAELARAFPWAYVPALYRPAYTDAGELAGVEGPPDLPPRRPALVTDLEEAPFPTRPLVPWVESTHDRVAIEIMRGCVHGCRFCEAGMHRRPLRLRSRERVTALARESIRNTGYDEVSLLSLSSSDHPELREMMGDLEAALGGDRVGLALPSLRVDRDLVWLPQAVKGVRKSTLTLAPEAATDRLRAVINKDISTEDLLAGALEAWRQGWRALKLYFMLGLPTEADEDVRAIADLAEQVSRLRGKVSSGAGRVSVTVSTFVPRPWTPFQWEAMAPPEEIRRRQALLKESLGMRSVKLRFHHPERSLLEAVLGRGDRRVAPVIARARELGAVLDGWDDHFDWGLWLRAFADCGVDPNRQGLAARAAEGALPWDHLACGVDPSWLAEERARALAGRITPSCQYGGCTACGHDPGLCRRLRGCR